jgi:putative transposase
LYVLEALKARNLSASAKGTIEKPGKNVARKPGFNMALLGALAGRTKTYLHYKARRRGKLLLEVAPHYPSHGCAACGFNHPDNRKPQSELVCQNCDNRDNARTTDAEMGYPHLLALASGALQMWRSQDHTSGGDVDQR